MAPKTELKPLTHDDILGAQDRPTEVVDVPEWGGTVTVRALSGAERDKYQSGFQTWRQNDKGILRVVAIDNTNAMARLVALSVVDAEGKRMFSDGEVTALGERSAKALERVSDVAMRLSGLELQSLEVAKEGLKATPNGSHGSD